MDTKRLKGTINRTNLINRYRGQTNKNNNFWGRVSPFDITNQRRAYRIFRQYLR